MELGHIWIAYAQDRLGAAAETARALPVSPMRGIELLWNWHPVFTTRANTIADVEYNEAFNETADGALSLLALNDNFDAWERLSAGAWRVLFERLVYAETVMLANEISNNPVITYLPEGLSFDQQSKAIGLMYLLGGARTIDRRLLAKSKPGILPPFPASTSLRRQ